MAEAIKMPRMSDTMTEGVIVEWHKKVGDKIKPGDLIADVETDKATMELESYNEGTILYLAVEKGKSVPVEGLVAIIGKEGEDYQSVLDAEKGQKSKTSNKSDLKPEENKSKENKPEEDKKEEVAMEKGDVKSSDSNEAALPEGAKLIRMPLMSDTMKEGKIIQWLKNVGDIVKSDDTLAEVETDKATMDVVGYEEGTLLYITTEAGNAAKINDVIAIVGKEGTDISAYAAWLKSTGNTGSAQETAQTTETKENKEETKNTESVKKTEEESTEVSSNDGGRIKASPLAKKLAQEKGIDIAKVSGSGDGGRIVKKDVDAYEPKDTQKQENQKEASGTVKSVQPFAAIGEESYEDIPNSQMRKTIARRLGESKYQAPHFYLTMEINMDNAMTSRKSMNEVSPVKISFNDLVIKACGMALRLHPAVNSSWMGDFIRQNKHIHIGS
ncbi:MAG: biotin/lipoyl-containing protein, partial [Ginsengibacter sp.]